MSNTVRSLLATSQQVTPTKVSEQVPTTTRGQLWAAAHLVEGMSHMRVSVGVGRPVVEAELLLGLP